MGHKGACAVTMDNTLMCWGSLLSGAPIFEPAKYVFAKWESAMLVAADGTVKVWGYLGQYDLPIKKVKIK